MKVLFSFSLFILILFIFQVSFAQKYEYNILGEHFSDTAYTNKTTQITSNPPLNLVRKPIFDAPEDTTYIYHQIGQNENVEYISNLYQICAPCFAKWNDLQYASFELLQQVDFYEGEYVKVALKTEYEKGTAAEFKTRMLYQTFEEETYLYSISERYEISIGDLRSLNNLNPYAYEVENITLIVGKMEYKYACSCLE